METLALVIVIIGIISIDWHIYQILRKQSVIVESLSNIKEVLERTESQR